MMEVTRRNFLKTLGITGIAVVLPIDLAVAAIKEGRPDKIKIDGDYVILSERDFQSFEESLKLQQRFCNLDLMEQGIVNLIFGGKPIIDAKSLDAAIGRKRTMKMYQGNSRNLKKRLVSHMRKFA